MRRLRDQLTYSNVMVTILAFAVLGGGAAYAASHVGKKSVGTKQLKANAVTTAKIKKNAVTAAKIKAGSINSSKIADGSVTGTDINQPSTPFSRIVFETRGGSAITVNEKLQLYPLANPVYTQEAGSDDMFTGAFDASFNSSCEPPRNIEATVLADAPNPTDEEEHNENNRVAGFNVFDPDGKTVLHRVTLNPFAGLFQPAAPTQHTLSLVFRVFCAGKPGSATVTFGAIDVIGTKK